MIPEGNPTPLDPFKLRALQVAGALVEQVEVAAAVEAQGTLGLTLAWLPGRLAAWGGLTAPLRPFGLNSHLCNPRSLGSNFLGSCLFAAGAQPLKIRS